MASRMASAISGLGQGSVVGQFYGPPNLQVLVPSVHQRIVPNSLNVQLELTDTNLSYRSGCMASQAKGTGNRKIFPEEFWP